ncbi:MAG: type III PLP-dependent enzyme [candidate division Zixibacteria bacterium]
MKAISLRNKPGTRHLRGIDLRRVRPIFKSVDTPFMVLRTGRIRHNINRLRDSLPDIEIYYAVKANDHDSILRTLIDEKCNFDISSVRELDKIVENGGQVNSAIHTNPIKMIPEFDAAVNTGVRTFAADNILELEKFSKYGDRAGVLIRFKTDTGASAVNLSYKFGAELSDIPDILDRIKDLGLTFRGFCFHVGSQCTETDLYIKSIKTAGKLIGMARAKGFDSEILDIGGGFPIEYTANIPSIEDMGRAIIAALKEYIDPYIKVICEPGRFICGDSVTLFTSVIGKTVRDGKKWYYIDDGLYGSFSGRLYDHCSYQIVTNRNTKWEKAVLAGPTCDSFDVVYENCLLPPLELGDILMFPAMGAYCSVSATDFNGLKHARIVTVDW